MERLLLLIETRFYMKYFQMFFEFSVKGPLKQILSIFFTALQRSLDNFFGRIFVTVFFVEIFNFMGYANKTTRDIKMHNDF